MSDRVLRFRRIASGVALAFAALAFPLAAQAAEQDRVSDETVRLLRGPLAAGARVKVDRFLIDGVPRTLQLERFEVWDPNAEIIAEGDGVRTRLAVPSTRLFRGRIAGDDESLVFVSVDGEDVTGFVTSGDRRYDIRTQMRRARGAERPNRDVFVEEAPEFDDSVVPARGFSCGVEGREMHAPPDRFAARSESLGGLIPVSQGTLGTGTATRTLALAIEADYLLYHNQFLDSTATVNLFITNLVGAASVIYQRDLRTDLVIVFSRTQISNDTSLFFYPTSGADLGNTLDNLGDIWHNAPPSAVPHSSVVRLSGSSLGAGIAWVGTACQNDFPSNGSHWGGRYAYCGGLTSGFGVANDGSVPDPNATVNGVQYEAPSLNYWALLEFSHELGHNVNADHTHCVALTSAEATAYGVPGRPYVDICRSGEGGCYSGAQSVPPEKGTIMSYCHLLGGGNSTRFLFGKTTEPSDKIQQEMLALLTGSRVPDSPSISAPSSISNGATASASIIGPVGGQTYIWTISNGAIVGSATGTSINFTGSADPVTLRVRTTKVTSDPTNGCSASDYRTVTYVACQAPSVTVPPQNITITAGTSTTLSVTATGGGPLSYQWYIGTSGTTTTPTGTNSSTLTVSPGATTNYWVRVTGSCGTANSTTATVTIAPAAGPASHLYLLTPCRLIDTRNPVGPLGGPSLASGVVRLVTAVSNCGIPADAKSLSTNVTAVGASSNGWLTLYPGDGSGTPLASTLNYSSGRTTANNAIISLSIDGRISVYNSGPQAINFIVDVNGYFK